MNKISSEEAFSILDKWCEDAAILQFGYNDTRTGEFRSFWVLVSRVISEGSPAVMLSHLADPFPFFRVDLRGAEYEYGDHREFSEDEMLAKVAERGWICFLLLKMPSGSKLMLSELRRDLPVDFNG